VGRFAEFFFLNKCSASEASTKKLRRRKARAGQKFPFSKTLFLFCPARANFLQSPARPASWRGGQNQSGFCLK